MSTLKTTNLQHPSAGSPAIVLDADGDAAYAGVHDFSAATVTGVGKILQVVRATDTTQRTTTSTSFVDVTGMSVTITPQKSTSAILIFSTFVPQIDAAQDYFFQITDSSNTAISGAENVYYILNITGTRIWPLNLMAYATPATTSATTYKLRFKVSGSTGYVRNELNTGQMYAIEVSA